MDNPKGWISLKDLKQRQLDYPSVDTPRLANALAWCLIFSVFVGSLM